MFSFTFLGQKSEDFGCSMERYRASRDCTHTGYAAVP
jgi:hypothetical protein